MKYNIYQIKPEKQDRKSSALKIIAGTILSLLLGIFFTIQSQPLQAITNPIAVSNNRFGIHLVSPTEDEASSAATLVNSSGGNWGYATVVMENDDLNHDKWQSFFNILRRDHLIPIIRLATHPDGDTWEAPQAGMENTWANFLDSLDWPTQNRYIVIYNEPNQGQEWGGKVDSKAYADILAKTITALKNKNSDFFVLNAGFDASAPEKQPDFEDEMKFLQEMNQADPGIFNELDGWTSHSYPNPGFVGSPSDTGRGTIETWKWELGVLQSLGVKKSLPIFITETGWKHAEGLYYDKSLPTTDQVGKYFQQAFTTTWNDPRIVAITPFILDYQGSPFDHFSFKQVTGQEANLKVLGAAYPDFYSDYQAIQDIAKTAGKPQQQDKAQVSQDGIYSSIVLGQDYVLPITFKNTGESIWGEDGSLAIKALSQGQELNFYSVGLSSNSKIEPGDSVTFNVHLEATKPGTYNLVLQLYNGNKAFDQEPISFNIAAKSPVIIINQASLDLKNFFAGNYTLSINSNLGQKEVPVYLDNQGKSQPMELDFLLPDYEYDFTLSKPFYEPKTIHLKVIAGTNLLRFGPLQPNFLSALFYPSAFWNLLPFSN